MRHGHAITDYSLNLDHMDNTLVYCFMEFAKILPTVSQCNMKLKYLRIGNHGKAKLSFRNITFLPMSTGNLLSTVQSPFSDILFSDKSLFCDNFAEDHFFSTLEIKPCGLKF